MTSVQKAAVLVVLLTLIYHLPVVNKFVPVLYEDIFLAAAPSAERAYQYADRYFDAARHPHQYDILRAEQLFRQTLVLDPSYPYVHHQLGRIYFLRGDYDTALWHLNKEIEQSPEPSPSSYYTRGLVLGFMERYEEAVVDFEQFLSARPGTWAALNDYAWVLLKESRFKEAAAAAEKGLEHMPESPWLLNTSAIAHYELGELETAFIRAQSAVASAEILTEEEWLTAYPGNDPQIAQEGIIALRQSTLDNAQLIRERLDAEAVQ